MRCEWASELMSLRLDGRAHDEAGLNQHLVTCPGCRQRWTALQAVNRLLSHPPMVEPPAGFAFRVMARIADRQVAPTSVWRTLGGWGLLLLATTLLGLAFVSPFALQTWQFIRQPSLPIDSVSMVALVLFEARELVQIAAQTANSLLTLIPAPILVGYMLTALLLATAWVAIVGHLHLQRSESRA